MRVAILLIVLVGVLTAGLCHAEVIVPAESSSWLHLVCPGFQEWGGDMAVGGFQRGIIRLDPTLFPQDFQAARLRLYCIEANTVADPSSSAEIDVLLTAGVPENVGAVFEPSFRYGPIVFVGHVTVHGATLEEIDVTLALRELLGAGAPGVWIHLQTPLQDSAGLLIAGYQSASYPHPGLVFDGTVKAEDKSLGAVKRLFR